MLIILYSCGIKNYVPTGLMVEFIRQSEQTKILDSKPEFSWIVPDEVKYQTAFQIQVASSKSKLEKSDADIWNSEIVKSKNSVEIEYDGPTLKNNSTYHWRVRVLDDQNNVTDFSSIQSFTTGKLSNYATTKNSFQSSLIKPVKFIKTDNSHYFIDFGKDAFGTLLLLDIKTSVSDSMIIHFGENANKNKVDRDPARFNPL